MRARLAVTVRKPARNPHVVLPAPHHAAFVGRAAPIVGAVVTGWSSDGLAPDRPIELSVVIDGAVVDRVACEAVLDRRPAEMNGSPGQARMFRYEIGPAFRDGGQHTIVFRHGGGSAVMFEAPDGAVLPAAAFAIPAETGPADTRIEGFVDGVLSGGISGWAMRQDGRGMPSGAVELLVSCDGEPIARIVADRFRPDVGEAKGCDPNVGFNFQPPARYRTGRSYSFTFQAIPEYASLHNSPFVTSFPTVDAISGLHALHEMARHLCLQVWSLERKLQEAIAGGSDTVATYDGWARRYFPALRAAVVSRRLAPPGSAIRRGVPGPLVSVVMPTFQPNLEHITAAVDSVRAQTYQNWELLIVDDGSNAPELSAYLRWLEASDARIKVSRHDANKGISAATNAGIARAGGDYVALLDHDDLLVDVALEVMTDAARRTGATLLYSDEDKIDERGQFSEPHFKPDYNWRLLLGVNYLCHLTMIERGVLRAIGPLRGELDGAQDHDLFLRTTEAVGPARIHHVPEVLYHWRKSPGSVAQSAAAKSYAVQAGTSAVSQHLRRRGFAQASVSPVLDVTMYSIDWRMSDEPSVVVIVPFRDQADTTRHCVDLLLDNTDYRNYKLVLVDNWSCQPETAAFCAQAATRSNVSLMRLEEAFNYSRLNNKATSAHPAEFYVFLNNDVFLTQRNWLRIMMNEALADPEVGIVGAKLFYGDGTLQHGGVVLGVGGVADHAFKGIGPNDTGYFGRPFLTQQYSAVTAALMLCRADVFAAAGRFDETDLAIAFNDVDLCLKAGQAGYKVVWSAEAVAEHHESLSRGSDEDDRQRARFFTENQVMMRRWAAALAKDPFYSKNFSKQGGVFKDLSDPTGPQP